MCLYAAAPAAAALLHTAAGVTPHQHSPLPAAPLQVFLRAGQMAVLDKLRADTMAAAATCIQRHMKGHLTRKAFRTRRDAVLCFQSWVRGEPHQLSPCCMRWADWADCDASTAVPWLAIHAVCRRSQAGLQVAHLMSLCLCFC